MSLTRRQLLLRSAAVVALPVRHSFETELAAAQAPAAPTGPFALPPLPYAAVRSKPPWMR
ncbi:MAG: hypothetical protein U0Q11_21775 [Vicinamibacterales bacterium]